MTHFEYISVAQALLFSFVVGRLLTGVAPATRPERAYWVQLCWIAQSFVGVAGTWWGFWGAREVDWTPLRFLWALSLPSLMFVRVSILVGSDPGAIASFRDHFHANRVRFFSASVVTNLFSSVSPLINDAPWSVWLEIAPFAVPTLAVNVAGLLTSNPRVHGVLAVLSLAFNLVILFLLPTGR